MENSDLYQVRQSKRFVIRNISRVAKRVIILAVAVVIGIAVFSFVFSPPKTELEGGEYVEGMVGQPTHINPLFAQNNEVDRTLSYLIFRGLTRHKENKIVGDLAQRWEVSDDQTLYRFYLRHDAKWHDGQAVTSADVFYTIQVLQDPDYQGSYKAAFANTRVQIIDEYSLEFVLEEPFAPFLDQTTLGILPSHLLKNVPVKDLAENSFNLQPVGTGDFSFQKITYLDKAISSLVLKGVKKPGNGGLDSIKFVFFDDYKSALDALIEGSIHAFGSTFLDVASLLNQYDSVKANVLPLRSRLFGVFINTAGGNVCLAEDEVRLALAEGIDKGKLKDLIPGGSYLAAGPLPDMATVATSQEGNVSYSPDEARFLIEKHSCKDKTFILTYPSRDYHQETVQELEASWEALGLHIDLNPVSFEDLSAKILPNHEFELLLFAQEISRDPDQYAYWHSTQQPEGLNITGISDNILDRSLEKGRLGTEKSDRDVNYQKFLDRFNELMPEIVLYYPNYTYFSYRKIENKLPNVMFQLEDRFTYVNEWTISRKSILGS